MAFFDRAASFSRVRRSLKYCCCLERQVSISLPSFLYLTQRPPSSFSSSHYLLFPARLIDLSGSDGVRRSKCFLKVVWSFFSYISSARPIWAKKSHYRSRQSRLRSSVLPPSSSSLSPGSRHSSSSFSLALSLSFEWAGRSDRHV